MSAAAKRTAWDIARLCIIPQWSFQSGNYLVESVDELDKADCWHFEVEWLGLHFQMAGGRFKPGLGQ